MDKKILIIIILSLIIIGLVWFIFSGNSQSKIAFEQIREQRNELIRSTAVIESELGRSISANSQLETDNIELRNDNTELEQIIGNITGGSEETEKQLGEYGRINYDFADFIQQNTALE